MAQPQKNTRIEARSLTKILHEGPLDFTLVKDVSFEVQEGEFIALTGASGSGKSSLLYLLGLLDAPTSGDLFFDGREMSRASAAEKQHFRLKNLGFVFQFHFLLPEFTALENVMLPMRKLGERSFKTMEREAKDLLDQFDLAPTYNKVPAQLSGGERQRVAVARALANNPEILLADEPTGNLDSVNSKRVMELFSTLQKTSQTTIVMITHDESLAKQADKILVMKDGRLLS